MEKDFDFSQITYYWSLCYIAECSRKEECMRYQVQLLAPQEMTHHSCVLPTVMQKDECPYFHPIQKVRAAVGFRKIFAEVKEKDHAPMRYELAQYLGRGGSFYRYRNGERLLMPNQQEWIKNLFRRYGYTEEVCFDGYKEVYKIR